MRLLLINPRFPESFWSLRWAINDVLPARRSVNPPLGLATLAALCPPHWHVTIVDENIEPVPASPEADLIGICGMGVQAARQSELLRRYRERGYFVVAGGSFASLCPERYADVANAVVAGEAEHIWPRFCRDFEAGTPAALYRETGSVDLRDSPTPRFDLLKLRRYSSVSMQFSRGCPFLCEFCDIIVMFGRRPRVKSLDQIGRELDALRAQGVRRVFFVDDNLIGHKPQARELLRFLRQYQERHGYRFTFGTEASINLARDEELMRLFRDANFCWVFLGIETSDEASLRETRKMQNIGGNLLDDVRRLYAHGIDVLAGFIVGFDNDTLDTFDVQYDFVMDSGISVAMIGLLYALPRTPLYERLRKEGRLRDVSDDCDNTRPGTNIVPKQMPYDEMVRRWQHLYHRLLSDRAIADRIRNKMRFLRHPVPSTGLSVRERALVVWRLLTRGILPGGPRRWWNFLRTLAVGSMDRLATVVGDWITGLSMASFVARTFDAVPEEATCVERGMAAVRGALRRYLQAGKLACRLRPGATVDVSMALGAPVDAGFYATAAKALERLLRTTRISLCVRLESFHEQHRQRFAELLERLARFGDRVSIVVDEHLRALLPTDLSRFTLVLTPR